MYASILERNQDMMVKIQGRVKGKTGDKCHILYPVDRSRSGLEGRKWVGEFFRVLAEE